MKQSAERFRCKCSRSTLASSSFPLPRLPLCPPFKDVRLRFGFFLQSGDQRGWKFCRESYRHARASSPPPFSLLCVSAKGRLPYKTTRAALVGSRAGRHVLCIIRKERRRHLITLLIYLACSRLSRVYISSSRNLRNTGKFTTEEKLEFFALKELERCHFINCYVLRNIYMPSSARE